MIYFMRHGESQANADGVFAGPTYSAPLTDQGKSQAQLEGARIKNQGITFDRIISSPIERAKETAELLAQAAECDPGCITYDKRLAEYDMGALSGQPKANVDARQRTSAEGAEDPVLFQARIIDCLKEISTLPGNTLVVAHAGVAGIIEATRIGSDIRDFYNEGYPNARVVELDLTTLFAAHRS
jgi:broad specificity phosphatase PhoE